MAIRYHTTVTSYSCPHCGKVYKTNAGIGLGLFFLLIGTAFTALSWFFTIWIIRTIFGCYDTDMPSIGNPIRTCPHCGNKFTTDENQEWDTLDIKRKKNWSYRSTLRILYTISGFVPLFLILQFLWSSNHESDRTIALILLILTVIIISIISVAYRRWEKYRQTNEIVLSQSDFDIVKASLRRTKKHLSEEYPPIKIKENGKVYGVTQQKTKVNETTFDKQEQKENPHIAGQGQRESSETATDALNLENDSADTTKTLLKNPLMINSSVNYQFACVALPRYCFSKESFNRNYGNTENTTKWIESILNAIGYLPHLPIEKEYYDMPFRFEERNDPKVRAIVVKIPDAQYECECNYAGIVERQSGIRYFTNELYAAEKVFRLCEFMPDGSHRAYAYAPENFDDFIKTILKT